MMSVNVSNLPPKPHRRLFQFSLRELLLSVTLIGVGLPGCVLLMRDKFWLLPAGFYYFVVPASLMSIAAGVGAPFRKKLAFGTLGFLLGVAIAWLWANLD